MANNEEQGGETSSQKNKIVLFADFLGFAALTETYPLDPVFLRRSDGLELLI